MEITIYGFLLIPFLFILTFLNEKIVVALLILSLTLQVTSLINLQNYYSLQIYRYITILLTLKLFIKVLWANKIKFQFVSIYEKRIVVYGTLFVVFSILSSIILPLLFEGYPVFPGYLGIDYSAIHGPSPLEFTMYNIAFPIYILFYFGSLVMIMKINWNLSDIKLIKYSFYTSIFISFIVAFSQILNILFNLPDLTKIFYTIVTRELHYAMIGNFIPLPRIQSVYQEPSMFAPFITGVFSFFLYDFIKKYNINKLIFLLISFLIIIVTTSAVAYITTALMVIIVLFFLNQIKVRKFNVKLNYKLLIKTIFGLAFISLVVVLLIFLLIGLEKFIKILELYFFNKSETQSYYSRTTADLHAIKLFLETYGLGVGLGSNRPSSLLPYLLSQVGVIGTFLFFIFILTLIKLSFKALKNSPYFNYFFLLPSVVIAQLIAYPDITNPTMWQFIYLIIIISKISVREKYENLY